MNGYTAYFLEKMKERLDGIHTPEKSSSVQT